MFAGRADALYWREVFAVVGGNPALDSSTP
jgi:hypothetical protein